MTGRHITLATIATVLTILGSVTSGVFTVKKYMDGEREQAIVRTTQRERHEEEIDRRLSALETVVRDLSYRESPRERELIDQLLAVKAQVSQISQDQKQEQKIHRFGAGAWTDQNATPADAPATRPPQ